MKTEPSLLAGLLYMPAEQLLALLERFAPAVADATGLMPGALSIPQSVVVSVSCWILGIVVLWLAYRLARRIVRIAGFASNNLVFHTRRLVSGIRTRLMTRDLCRRSGGSSASTPTAHNVEFSAVEIAILIATTKLGPGFATSAPELADRLRRRPAEIQRSLEKLYRNKLLDTTIGSTDGFDNYVISTSGMAFTTMFARR